jgi:hypothetical protein
MSAPKRQEHEKIAPKPTRVLQVSAAVASLMPTTPMTPETTMIENGWRVVDNSNDDGQNYHHQSSSTVSLEDKAMEEMYRRLLPQKPFNSPKITDAVGLPPQIYIMQEGNAEQIETGQYKFVASITLIQDNGKNILVDTGLSTDGAGKNRLIASATEDNLLPL